MLFRSVIILFALLAGVCAGGLRLVEAETDQDSWFMENDELLAAKERMENIFDKFPDRTVLPRSKPRRRS